MNFVAELVVEPTEEELAGEGVDVGVIGAVGS